MNKSFGPKQISKSMFSSILWRFLLIIVLFFAFQLIFCLGLLQIKRYERLLPYVPLATMLAVALIYTLLDLAFNERNPVASSIAALSFSGLCTFLSLVFSRENAAVLSAFLQQGIFLISILLMQLYLWKRPVRRRSGRSSFKFSR